MRTHQVNECSEAIKDQLIKEHKDDIPPFVPSCNTNFGQSCEVHHRQLMDGLRRGAYSTGTCIWGKEQIAAAIFTIENILHAVKYNGQYCFYCGYLHSEEVTNIETCSKCGAILPH